MTLIVFSSSSPEVTSVSLEMLKVKFFTVEILPSPLVDVVMVEFDVIEDSPVISSSSSSSAVLTSVAGSGVVTVIVSVTKLLTVVTVTTDSSSASTSVVLVDSSVRTVSIVPSRPSSVINVLLDVWFAGLLVIVETPLSGYAPLGLTLKLCPLIQSST